MMYKTHLVFGIFVAILVLQLFEIENPILFFLLICFASLLPDIDFPKSWIGRRTKPISWIIRLLFGHRKFIHTIYVPFILFFLLSAVGQKEIGMAIFIGYLVHLFADGLSSEGIKPFYPFSRMRFKGIVRVGGLLETIVLIGLIIFILIILF